MPDVKLPDGTIVRNVPEGTTRAQLMARLEKAEPSMWSKIGDVARGVADSASLGFFDEIDAAVDSVTGFQGKRGDYKASLAASRKRDAEGGNRRLAGQIIGGFALPTGKAGLARSLATGLGYGAAYGAGSAEGGIRERLEAAPEGAALGLAGAAVGNLAGKGAARLLRGKKVSPAVRKLADEGIVMTPGRRGGAVKRAYEESVLGSVPFVKSVPAAANRRSIEQLNVATYNRVLKPLGAKLPMNTKPGREAVEALGERVFTAYDDAASRLVLGADDGVKAARTAIVDTAEANVGENAKQLKAIVNNTLAPLDDGPLTGSRVRDLLQDLRGEASAFVGSSSANERRLGKELWGLHDHLEAALVRQNKGDVLKPFKAARSAVSNLKRVEAAAAKAPDGIFNPQQLHTAVTKRGYGTTTSKVARGKAPMQDLSDAAKQVLPATIPNSGTPERATAMAAMFGGPSALAAFVDPTMGAMTAAPLIGYAPGVDRLLQNFALNRPGGFVATGNALERAAPALGLTGAVTALNYGR